MFTHVNITDFESRLSRAFGALSAAAGIHGLLHASMLRLTAAARNFHNKL